MKKSLKDVMSVMSRVTCGEYQFNLEPAAGGFALTVNGPIDDMHLYADTPLDVLNMLFHPKRWFISTWSTQSEIIRTAYKAVDHYLNARVEAWAVGFGNRASGCDEITELIELLNYKDTWRISIESRDNEMLWKLMFDAVDNENGTELETQHCRKHFVDTNNMMLFAREIAVAVQTAEAHELNEQFKFDGVDLYNPHLNLPMFAKWIDENKINSNFYDIRPVMDKQY